MTIDFKHVPMLRGWEIGEVLGKGSFGTVYEIRKRIGNFVDCRALKVISLPKEDSDINDMRQEGIDEESIIATFQSKKNNILHEYEMQAQMAGTANIVNCDDIDAIPHPDGIGWDIFIRMEKLTTLQDSLPDATKPVPNETVRKLAEDMCKALILCGQHGIVHRDIKPQNIFISKNGDYKLGDFGVARTIESGTVGTVTGTPPYMAPEIARNEKYDRRVDIYSLGIVLYWLLNYRRLPLMPPYPQKIKPGDRENAVQARISGTPVPPPPCGDEVLKRVAQKACAFKPQDRYQSAEEMLKALHEVGGGSGNGGKVDPDNHHERIEQFPNLEKVVIRSNGYVAVERPMGYDLEGTAVLKPIVLTPKTDNVKALDVNSLVVARTIYGVIAVKYPDGKYWGVNHQNNRVSFTPGQFEEILKDPNTIVRGKQEEKKKKKKSILPLILGAGAAVVAIVLAVVLLGGGGEGPDTKPNVQNPSQTQTTGTKPQGTTQGGQSQTTTPTTPTTTPTKPTTPPPPTTTTPPPTTTVPETKPPVFAVLNVQGQLESEAKKALENQGFVVVVTTEYNDSVTEGRVIRQTPAASSMEQIGTEIHLVVSLGKDTVQALEMVTTPDKNVYIEGDTLDATGISLLATYASGKAETVTTGFTCSITTLSGSGNVTITVTYENAKATFQVEVIGDLLASGICGSNLRWALQKNGTMTILGTGSMSNYAEGSTPWKSHVNQIKRLDVREGVTGIGNYAFTGCTQLSQLTLAEGVATLGKAAFSGCTKLTEVYVPGTVTTVGDELFKACTGLTTAVLGEGIAIASKYMFAGCTGLTAVTLPESLTRIDNRAFEKCTGLTQIRIPAGVKMIGQRVFGDCDSLSRVTVLNAECFITSGISTLGVPGITVVYGYEGSTAQSYAEKNGFTFAALKG
ncbi:MAG: PASTA domain-containing protein [Ruminococcaceae bacterium]|nr:PASTA domain-containing protein [Oscillospiraceae bacterium]